MFACNLTLHCAEFIEKYCRLIFGGRLTVPAIIALDGADTFAGDGVREYERRLFCDCGGFVAGGDKLGNVVPVYLEYVPPEGLIFFPQRLKRHDVLRHAIYLDVVAVHDGSEIVETVLSCEHRAFPCVALLLFAIRHRTENAEGSAIHARGICVTGGLRESRAQGAGRRLETGEFVTLGMSLQTGAELTECEAFLEWEISRVRHRGVAHRRDVAVREDEPIPRLPIRMLRVMFEDAEIERSENV